MIWLALLFAIAIVPWLIPVATSMRVVTGVLVVLVLGTVFGPAFFSIDGPIQISLDRAVWFAFSVVVAMRLIRGGESLDTFNRTDAIVFAFAGWALASCVAFGMNAEGQSPIARWLFYCAFPFSVYVVCRIRLPLGPSRSNPSPRNLAAGSIGNPSTNWRTAGRNCLDPHVIESVTTALVVLTAYLSVTAVFEMMDFRTLVFPRFINDAGLWEFYGRGRGPLLNPAGNGILMSVGLAACVSRFFSSGRYGKALYAALAMMMLAGCYATLTRSVWMGAAVTLAVLATFYIPVRVRVLGLVMVVLLGGAMTMGLKEQLMAIKRDKALSAAEAAKSVELRPLLAVVAIEMFKDRPIVGHGYGQYYQNSEPYHAIRRHGIPLEKVRPYMQHNVFLSILVDLGLIGLSLHILLLVTFFAAAWRLACHHRDGSPERGIGMLTLGMLCGYVVNGCFHEVAIIEMMHMFLFALGGLTVTIASQSLSTAKRTSSGDFPSPIPETSPQSQRHSDNGSPTSPAMLSSSPEARAASAGI